MERLFDSDPKVGGTVRALDENAPLAVRMRPKSLDHFVGQGHLLSPGSSLHDAITADRPPSMILYGPPGSGKTTLARIVAEKTQSAFEELSAVNAGSKQVREVIARARERRGSGAGGTIFFLDEIHRFNKAQQDALLPAVEDGVVTLIGATTENPYFEVNSALISRCRIYELKELGQQQVLTLLERAHEEDAETGQATVAQGVLDFIAARSGGDARVALNALELACETAELAGKEVTIELAQDAMQQKALLYDREGDKHYDYISAFIKSMRGSDPDAAIYYLAVMLEGGEDPRFIARRMVIFASEDVGNADPEALKLATASAQAVEHVGMPECRINLSQAACYLALAPKSNSAITAIDTAMADVRQQGAAGPPDYIRDASYPGARELGRGQGYDYPHKNPDALSSQQLLPDELKGKSYYRPKQIGLESELAKRMDEIHKRKGK